MLCDDAADTEKETASWKTEVETLKQKLAAHSEVCGFVNKDSDVARLVSLCCLSVLKHS